MNLIGRSLCANHFQEEGETRPCQECGGVAPTICPRCVGTGLYTKLGRGNAINYQDNTTREWTPYAYLHTDTPTIHPEAKPDFPAGESLCEETTYARKYIRVEEDKQPLMGVSWIGTDSTAETEIWFNLRTVGADISAVLEKYDHWTIWQNAWVDSDYRVQFYDPGGIELCIKTKSIEASMSTSWTIKTGINSQFFISGTTGLPVFYNNGKEIMYFDSPRLFVDDAEPDTYPTPIWSIITASPYNILSLAWDEDWVEEQFEAGASSVEVRS